MRRKGRVVQSSDVLQPYRPPTGNLSRDLQENLACLKQVFEDAYDVIFRPIRVFHRVDAFIVFVDGLVDTKQLDADIIKPLVDTHRAPPKRKTSIVDVIRAEVLASGVVKQKRTFADVVSAVVEGQVVLLVHGDSEALVLGAGRSEQRAIEEPTTEGVIRGPREGFNENAGTSTALIRRRLRTADLKFETFELGTYTKTQVVIGYILGLADDKLVKEVRRRVQRIRIDGILESGYIEELIEEKPYSPFPTVQDTERPDVVAGQLLEGKVAIITDGTPFVLLVPTNLWSALQSPEDYYSRYFVATAIRWLRFLFVVIALALPSFYVAIVTFHMEMLPTNLLLSIAASRESIPFPAVVEAFVMEVTFEALREAGVRLPKTVGNAISIVGALVIGEAAVQAGLVSAPMVIVVSLTGIASFTIPRFNFGISIRMLRFPLIILAGTLGLFGIVAGFLAVVIHICSLRSFGVPYTQPVAPLHWKGLKDTFIRLPWWAMRDRPEETSKSNLQRQTRSSNPAQRQPQS